MKIILLFAFVCVLVVNCEHLVLGDTQYNRLMYHNTAQYHSIPFTKRIKNEFFSSPEQQVIKRIMVYDNLHSKAEVTVTAGGIGYTYVNFLMKSESGVGLDYDIGLYTE